MFPGKKKNRTSEAALLNLSFSRAACLPFAIILLCGRVETNSINPVSQGKVTGQKPCIHAGLSRFNGHSHSIVKSFVSVSPVCRSLFQFVEMTPIIKKSGGIAGSNLGHGFFRVVRGNCAGHGGSRQTASNIIKLTCVHCNLLPAWRISGGALQLLGQILDDTNSNSADGTDSAEYLASFIQDRVLSIGLLRLA